MPNRLSPILEAVRTQTEALGLELEGEALPVLLRRAATRRTGLDPAAMITVAKSATPEQLSRRRFNAKRSDYRIDVVVHGPYLGPDGDTSAYATMRDAIVDLFSKPPLAGAPAVFELRAEPADWLRPEGSSTDFDWWCVQVVASVVSAN